MPLSSEEIQIRRALIPKLKEETLSHDEAEELVTLLDKEKYSIGGRRRLYVISDIICQ